MFMSGFWYLLNISWSDFRSLCYTFTVELTVT
jgi:hypothetical protein